MQQLWKKKVELLTYFVLSGLAIPSGPSKIKIEPLNVLEGALDKTAYHVAGMMMLVCSIDADEHGYHTNILYSHRFKKATCEIMSC